MKRLLRRCLPAVLALMLAALPALASNFYIFPKSDKTRLTYEEVWAWQYDALGYAFNELFARYGRPFDPGGKFDNYFRSQTWYKQDPDYPGDGKALNNIEWANYSLIKQVRDEMRQMGTKNPGGKPLPNVFDDRISSPLSGFVETYFKPNQKLKVYDGPGTEYRRGANGKAVASTNGRVYVAGWESGWLMVMYGVNNGGVRTGFVSPKDFKDRLDVPQLMFERIPALTLAAAQLTEDPVMSLTPIAYLPQGTNVTWLSSYYAQRGSWDYVEVLVNGQPARGFLPPGIVDLQMTADPNILP